MPLLNRLAVGLAVIGGIAAAATVPTLAASAAPATQVTVAHRSSFQLSWRMTDLAQQDIGAKGASSGDTLQATYTVTSQRGSADYSCTLAGTKQYICSGVIHLRKGDLYVGVSPSTDDDPAAVLGGTGSYSGARGRFTQVERADGTGTWKFTLLH